LIYFVLFGAFGLIFGQLFKRLIEKRPRRKTTLFLHWGGSVLILGFGLSAMSRLGWGPSFLEIGAVGFVASSCVFFLFNEIKMLDTKKKPKD